LKAQIRSASIEAGLAMKLRGGMKRTGPSSGGFTRVDLVALLFLAFLGVALANPLFTSQARQRADALVCQANMAEIGRAFQVWSSDHEDRHPFLVSTNEGGLRGHFLAPNAYFQFASVSNGMSTAKILVCPADTNTTRRATDFSTNPDAGFMHPNFRNNALSYFISFHAQHHLPRSILIGDRNLEQTQGGSGCSLAGFVGTHRVEGTPGSNPSRWGFQIHWGKGNLLFNDGSVELASDRVLQANIGVEGLPRIHVLFPR
jgi:hypothetical protein